MDNKNFLFFIIGAAVGGVSTYFIVKGKYENEYQQKREELVNLYINKSSQPKIKKSSREKEKEDIVNRINNLVHMNNDAEEYKTKAIDYSTVQDDTYEQEDTIIQKQSMQEHPTEEDLPYIITEEEFADPLPQHDKVTLQYFIHDDILIDEMSHEVIDVSTTVSQENIDALIANGDYIYVRNNEKGTDYEVIVNQELYSEAEKEYRGIF